jgi:hypothetical protein
LIIYLIIKTIGMLILLTILTRRYLQKHPQMLNRLPFKKLMLKFVAPLFLVLFAFSYAHATDWKLKKDDEGIRIYTATVANSEIKAIKVEFTAKGSTTQLTRILLDINSQKDWVYSTKSASILKRVSEKEVTYYTEKSMPWPITNRDAVMDIKIQQDNTTGIMTVHATTVGNLVPEKKNIVRVPSSTVTWKVTPIGNNTMKIEYEAQADPGGTIPAWVTNMFLSKGPFETFKKLRVMLENENRQAKS